MRPYGVKPILPRLDQVVDQVDSRAMEFNIHEAKTHFSKILARVQAGEEVVIAKAGAPIARIVPIRTRRRPGTGKGSFWLADDFDAPLPGDMLDRFEGKP